VKNADENELRAIASPPEETHVYNAADFSVMSSIVEGLTRSICERVSELSREISGAFLRDLCPLCSGLIESHSLMPASVTVISSENYENPLTKLGCICAFILSCLGDFYVFSGETDPYSTGPPDAPSNLVTSEVTARSFRVSWTHAAGPVEKYRVVYYSSSGSRPEEVQFVCVFILKLFSNVVKIATFEHILAALNNRKGLIVYHFE